MLSEDYEQKVATQTNAPAIEGFQCPTLKMTEQDRTEWNRTEPDCTGQSRIEPDRTEPD